MKNVLVTSGEREYAINFRNVVEIVPLVELQHSGQNNQYLAGTMRYRGQSIPVVDLCLLLSGRPHQKKFSTRIVIVQLTSQTLGLIAENITDLVPDDAVFEKLDLESLLVTCL